MARSILLLLLACSATTTLAQPATFINLGPGTQANDVSDDGMFVAGAAADHLFRWSLAGGFENFGMGSGNTGTPPKMSADGNTIAWGTGTNFRWTPQTGVVSTTANGMLYGISGDGTTLVGNSGYQAYKWRSDTGMVYLAPPAPLSGGSTFAFGASFDGSVVAGGYNAGGEAPAARWDASGGHSLGNIPPYPLDSVANCITSDGTTIFGFGRGVGGYDAFRWTAATGMVGLGVGASGFNLPTPIDCTADGSILVGTTVGAAFVWRLGVGPIDIKQTLERDYGLDLSRYQLDQARGISADGRTVVGFGLDSETNQRFGWVVTLPWSIPAPGSAWFALVAATGLLRRRR